MIVIDVEFDYEGSFGLLCYEIADKETDINFIKNMPVQNEFYVLGNLMDKEWELISFSDKKDFTINNFTKFYTNDFKNKKIIQYIQKQFKIILNRIEQEKCT